MRQFRTAIVLLGLAAYAVAFYWTSLPSVCNDAGQPLLRVELLVQLLLLPDRLLLPNWFGSPAEFCVLDRLPVILVAAVIVAWAAAIGWLAMTAWRCCIPRCRPEETPGLSHVPVQRGGPDSSAIGAAKPQEGIAGRKTTSCASGTPIAELSGPPISEHAMALEEMPTLSWSRLETAVFSVAVGLNLVSTWVLLLGLFGVMGRLWVFWLPAASTFAVAAFVWRRGRPDRRTDVVCKRAAAPEPLGVPWLWLGLPFVLMIFLAAMTPPLDFDVREYHLQAPKEFFQQGRIAFLPHNVYADMALGTEMLSLLAMIVAGDWWLGALAGKLVIAVYAPLTAVALFTAGRRFFSQTAGVVAALVFLSIPWMTGVASGGLVEGASACYLFLAVYALMMGEGGPCPPSPACGGHHEVVGAGGEGGWKKARSLFLNPPDERRATSSTAFLVLAGYMTGAAVATKYPAVLFVLLPMMVWIVVGGFWRARGRTMERDGECALPSLPAPTTTWRQAPMGNARCVSKSLFVFLVAVAIGCGPWFAKNLVLTGNPTYPLLYGAFGGTSWTVAKDRQWQNVHRPHDFSMPTLVHDVGRVVLTSEWLSPLVVPLAALALIGRGRRFRARWVLLAYAGFIIAAWWLLTHRIDRFWIPVLPVLALLAGVGACWSRQRWWRAMLGTLLAAGLAVNFLVAGMGPGNAWFVGLETLRHSPERVDPWHLYFNAYPPDGQLLLVGDAAPFDLDVPVLYNTCFDDCIFEQLVAGRTAAEIRAALAARKIAVIYVNWSEIDRYRRTYGFTDFVQPDVLSRLVAEGVLTPLPPIEGHAGRAYRVLPPEA